MFVIVKLAILLLMKQIMDGFLMLLFIFLITLESTGICFIYTVINNPDEETKTK